MSYLVEVPLEQGAPIVIEVDEPEAGIAPAARPGEVVATMTTTFEASLERLRPVADAIIAKFRRIAESPDEVAVEFGFKMTTGAGLVIAHASGEASFKVSLVWKRD